MVVGAADTFRAAAGRAARDWAERAGPTSWAGARADPAAVVFDAVAARRGPRRDVVIVDTAGRLHTQSNLMEELAKIRRVISSA